MSNLRIWRGVPRGSRLELGVPPADEPFAARARMVDDHGNETIWGDRELRPGPVIQKLENANAFVVRIRVSFEEGGEAKVRALIRKKNGAVYGRRYQYVIKGKANDVVRATLVITMI